MSLPSKNAKWKDFFVFSKLPSRVVLPLVWRSSKVTYSMSRLGFPTGFRMINTIESIEGDLLEECIPCGGEAPYTWSTT